MKNPDICRDFLTLWLSTVRMSVMEHIKITTLPKGELEIEGSLAWEVFGAYEQTALTELLTTLELPGFRKGKVPEDVAKAHLGADTLLERAAEIALRDLYPNIITEHKIDAIGKPEIMITKLARSNPLEFKIKVATLPKIELGDYKARLQSVKFEALAEAVTDMEIDEALLDIRKYRAHQKLHEHDDASATAPHDHHDHPELTNENLPLVDDAFVATLGNFKTVDEFKAKLKDNLAAEKKYKNQERKRLALLDTLIASFTIEVPEVLVGYEIESMLARMKHDMEAMGLTFPKYLENVKKTEEDMRNDLRNDAEKRAKLELILETIAKTEGIEPDKEAMEKELEHARTAYPEADLISLGAYIRQVLTRNKVLEFIETLSS